VPKQFILYTKQTALLRLSSSVHYYKITQTCCYIVGSQTTKFPLLQKSKTSCRWEWGLFGTQTALCVAVQCTVSSFVFPAKNLRRNSNESIAISRQNESAVPLLLLQTICYWFLTDMLKYMRLLELVTEVNAIQ